MAHSMLLINKRKPKQISLTALIDAVFILLLFFMLSSTFIKQTTIELNSTHSSDAEQTVAEDPQLIILNSDDSVALYQAPEKSIEILVLLDNLDSTKAVIVLPTASTNVQSIVTVLSLIKSSGFSQVSLGQTID